MLEKLIAKKIARKSKYLWKDLNNFMFSFCSKNNPEYSSLKTQYVCICVYIYACVHTYTHTYTHTSSWPLNNAGVKGTDPLHSQKSVYIFAPKRNY